MRSRSVRLSVSIRQESSEAGKYGRSARGHWEFLPEATEQFILGQLGRAGLGHNPFTQEALALVVRSGEGLLRRTRNLCLSALIEAVRDHA